MPVAHTTSFMVCALTLWERLHSISSPAGQLLVMSRHDSYVGLVKDTDSCQVCTHVFNLLLGMQMVERLIEAGANVQLVDVRGYTALQCAAEGGHMGPFRNLLQAGCDPMAQDHAGVSVLHSACQGGCLEIINHLQSLGADPSDRTLQGRDCLHYAALGEPPHLHLPTNQPLHLKAATLFLPTHALPLCNEAYPRACSCMPCLPHAKVYVQLSEHRCMQQCVVSGSQQM